MIRKLLTDARETSYWIRSSLLTAECSTVSYQGTDNAFIFIRFHSITSSKFTP